MRKKERLRKKMREIIVVMIITIVLFDIFAYAAHVERGYAAFGGEYCAFLFPLFWVAVKGIVRDIKSEFFATREDEHEQ